MSDVVIAACDGAAKGNPGPSAWAWVVADALGEPQRWQAGPLGTNTNNVAELSALAELLESTDPAVPLRVRMDSQYAMNAATTWMRNWKRNGWLTTAKKPVANVELIQRIDALMTGRDVKLEYVPAHQAGGDPLNALADRAASHVARTQEAAGGDAAAAEDLPVVPTSGSHSGGAARSGRTGSTASAGSTGSTAAKPGGTRSIPARFPGTCHCGTRWAQGEQIAKSEQGWAHLACATAAG